MRTFQRERTRKSWWFGNEVWQPPKRSHSSYRKGNQLKSTSERASVLLPTQAVGADSNNELIGAESLPSHCLSVCNSDWVYYWLCQYGGKLHICVCILSHSLFKDFRQKKDCVQVVSFGLILWHSVWLVICWAAQLEVIWRYEGRCWIELVSAACFCLHKLAQDLWTRHPAAVSKCTNS